MKVSKEKSNNKASELKSNKIRLIISFPSIIRSYGFYMFRVAKSVSLLGKLVELSCEVSSQLGTYSKDVTS